MVRNAFTPSETPMNKLVLNNQNLTRLPYLPDTLEALSARGNQMSALPDEL